jgi:hypothetical protein
MLLFIPLVKHEPITDYFASLPSITYFPFLACRLRDLIIKLNEEIISDDQVSLKNIHDDIIDDILYLQDIFSLNIEKINYILTNSLFYYLILPLICGSLVTMSKPLIAISVSLYVILGFFHYVKNEHFLNLLFYVLFSEKLNKKLVNYMETFPKNIKNYFFDWNAQKKSTHNSFTNYISTNFSEPFIKSLVYQINPIYNEINSIIKKHDNLIDEMDINSEEYLKILIEDVLSKYTNSEFDIMTAYHKNISLATGVNVGLAMADHKHDSVCKIAERMFNKIKEGNTQKNFVKNGCREIMYIYLRSKDDTLILLMNLLIFTIHKKFISKELLSVCKLPIGSDITDCDYDTNTILNELFSCNPESNLDFSKYNEINTAPVKKAPTTEEKIIKFQDLIDTNIVNIKEAETAENVLDNKDGEIIYPKFQPQKNNLISIKANINGNSSASLNETSDIPLQNSERISSYLEHVDENYPNNSNTNSNKFSLFSNTYFKDFLIKNTELKPKTYDVELVDSLLNVRIKYS